MSQDPRKTSEEVDDEMLMALADNELPEKEAARLRAVIAADPGLASRFALFSGTANALREAWPRDPVPERLVQTVLDATGAPEARPVVVPLRRRPAASLSWPAALAAALVLGLGLGWLGGTRESAPVTVTDLPRAAAEALSRSPTGTTAELAGGVTARAAGSFETEFGLCRLLVLEGASAGRVIACREGDGWQIALSVGGGAEGRFMPAADLAVELADQWLDAAGAGVPLDAEAERRALDR
ncbi:MAG: anti-sigma factor family protein [Gemmobacter sp.]